MDGAGWRWMHGLVIPNKIWVDKVTGFYIRSMKSLLEKNDIKMYSTHNEGRYVAETFINTFKNKIYEYMI